MRLPFVLAILAPALFSVEVSSQEIRIGHLQTKDDPDAISSWVFFNCNRNGQAMICDAFQTLITYELRPEQRATDIENAMKGDPAKEFRDSFGKDCQSITAVVQSLKTGKAADGRPFNLKELPKEVQASMALFNAIADACANPNVNTMRRVMEVLTDQKIGTCKVSNFYSKMQFKWNEQTQNWISQVGPWGPCGTVSISTLKQEKPLGVNVQSVFWSYVEKRLITNPSGVLPNGLACSKFPEHTTSYSWQTPATPAECKYIQHVP